MIGEQFETDAAIASPVASLAMARDIIQAARAEADRLTAAHQSQLFEEIEKAKAEERRRLEQEKLAFLIDLESERQKLQQAVKNDGLALIIAVIEQVYGKPEAVDFALVETKLNEAVHMASCGQRLRLIINPGDKKPFTAWINENKEHAVSLELSSSVNPGSFELRFGNCIVRSGLTEHLAQIKDKLNELFAPSWSVAGEK